MTTTGGVAPGSEKHLKDSPTPNLSGEEPSFVRTLIRVMAVQIAALGLLWLLQGLYH